MTSKKYFQEQMQELERAFNSAYSKEQLSRCHEAIKGYESHHVKRAIDNLIITVYRLPTIAQVIQEIRAQWEHDWDRDKKTDKQVAKDILNGRHLKLNEPHTKDAFNLIKSTLFGHFDARKFYKDMVAMETKHPGFGWRENAEQLKKKTTDHPGRAPFTPWRSKWKRAIDELKAIREANKNVPKPIGTDRKILEDMPKLD